MEMEIVRLLSSLMPIPDFELPNLKLKLNYIASPPATKLYSGLSAAFYGCF
jgi:hypothetical protein